MHTLQHVASFTTQKKIYSRVDQMFDFHPASYRGVGKHRKPEGQDRQDVYVNATKGSQQTQSERGRRRYLKGKEERIGT